MPVSELEANYTPTKWSKRFDQAQLLAYYYRFAKEVTESARKNFECELDVPYGATERSKYDIYGTNLPNDSPIFVFVHGGYWQEGDKDVATFAVPVFVRKGIKVITIGYDLCPNVKLGDIVSQIKSAIEQILKYASSLGCRNVWISGHSAGAHLAVSLLYDKLWLARMIEQKYFDLLKGIVLIGGIFNLGPLVDTSVNIALKLTQDEINAFSFTTLDVKNSTPVRGLKVIVTDGECDSPGHINESCECAQKLITFVDNVQYVFLRENIDHFNIVENLTDEGFTLTKIILNNILDEQEGSIERKKRESTLTT